MLEALKTNTIADSPKPEQSPMELEDLVTLLRSRSAPLPAFVTEHFLANAINIVPRDTRLMHEDREWIRKATGYPWPEERPGADDMPRLYEEALRYPAFAIVFQHQFFPDDNNRGGRGLPKNLIIVKNADAWKRLRMKGPIPKGVNGAPFLRILHSVQNGGDKESRLAEALGLPGKPLGARGAPRRPMVWRSLTPKARSGPTWPIICARCSVLSGNSGPTGPSARSWKKS
jgi:hypothetical protein